MKAVESSQQTFPSHFGRELQEAFPDTAKRVHIFPAADVEAESRMAIDDQTNWTPSRSQPQSTCSPAHA